MSIEMHISFCKTVDEVCLIGGYTELMSPLVKENDIAFMKLQKKVA